MPGNATMSGPGRVGGGSGGTGDVTGVAAGNGILVTNPTGPVPTVAANNVSGDAGIVITQALGQDTFQQNIAAEWPVANMRVYAVDFVNGNDNNAGFADAAGTSAGQYATACQAAGAVAKKTIAGLAVIFPRIGNGRLVEIVIRNGGVNTEQSYTEGLDKILDGVHGYMTACPLIRGTGTNTTAGAVAFDGSTADVDYQGGITASGCNTAGYNPIAAFSTSVVKCLKVGGGAAALAAEPASPLGWRIRFDSATTTVALRNICRQVAEVSGGDTVTTQTALPATPVGTDVFYLEQPGVACPTYGLGSGGIGAPSTGMQISGVRSTGQVNVKGTSISFKFSGCSALFVSQGNSSNLGVTQILVHPVLGSRTVGGGMRSEGAASINSGYQQPSGLVAVGTLTFFQNWLVNWRSGGYAGAGCLVQNCNQSSGASTSTEATAGSATALAAPRCVGRLRWIASKGQIANLSITGAGANAAIEVTGQCVLAFDQGICSGATGNNDVGMDLTNSRGSLIILTSTPTVTGALGDIRLKGGQIVPWAQAIATGIVDSAGNRIYGTAGVPAQAITKASGSIVGGAGAVISYLADTGPIAANQIVPLRYPTSFRLATRLRVTNLVNTSANAVTVTLYKNAVATAMVVTIPAATAANTKFSDVAHPILFLDGDDFDLRMDDAADVGGVVSVSAALEWAA